jgi:hypothetical protein
LEGKADFIQEPDYLDVLLAVSLALYLVCSLVWLVELLGKHIDTLIQITPVSGSTFREQGFQNIMGAPFFPKTSNKHFGKNTGRLKRILADEEFRKWGGFQVVFFGGGEV